LPYHDLAGSADGLVLLRRHDELIKSFKYLYFYPLHTRKGWFRAEIMKPLCVVGRRVAKLSWLLKAASDDSRFRFGALIYIPDSTSTKELDGRKEKMNGKRTPKKVGGLISMAIVLLSILTATVWITPVGAATVTRHLPISVAPNEQFTVTLTQTGFLFDTGLVWEVLPEGFEYINGTYTGNALDWVVTYDPTTRTLRVGFRGENYISYGAKASPYAQTAVFGGTYSYFDNGTVEGNVTGKATVTVTGTPTPTPTPGVPRWDINEDCTVNYIDLAILSAHWNETTTALYPRYDINADGMVNYIDLTILSAHWNESTC